MELSQDHGQWRAMVLIFNLFCSATRATVALDSGDNGNCTISSWQQSQKYTKLNYPGFKLFLLTFMTTFMTGLRILSGLV
jgi:hypothetical protein